MISDLAGPHDGARDCFGLGVSLQEATRIAQEKAHILQTRIVTTQKACAKCGERFWHRGQPAERKRPERATNYLCSSCLDVLSDRELETSLKALAQTNDASYVVFSDWCG